MYNKGIRTVSGVKERVSEEVSFELRPKGELDLVGEECLGLGVESY